MPQVDPVAFGERLSKEMARTGLTISAFHKALQNKSGGALGTSYGSVWSYVKGQGSSEPRVELVEAMADVLGVLPDFLLSGRGPRTKEDAAMREAGLYVEDEGRDDQDVKRWRNIYRAISAAEARLPYLASTSFENTRDAILEDLTMAFFRAGELPLDSYTDEQFAEAILLLAWLITFPAAMLGPRKDMDEGYFMAMGSALAALMVRLDAAPTPVDRLARLRGAKEVWDSVCRASFRASLDPDEAAFMDILEEMGGTFQP